MARGDTPSAIARCFSSLRNLSKLAPLWQEAARAEGAARCGAGACRGAGANCAKAGIESTSVASAAIAIGAVQERGIVLRVEASLFRSYPNRNKKEIVFRRDRTGRMPPAEMPP